MNSDNVSPNNTTTTSGRPATSTCATTRPAAPSGSRISARTPPATFVSTRNSGDTVTNGDRRRHHLDRRRDDADGAERLHRRRAAARAAAAVRRRPVDGGHADTPEPDRRQRPCAAAAACRLPAPAPAGPVVIDDGVLSQAELDLIVDAAIARWAAAGASDAQIAAMRAVTVSVADLAGLTLGESGVGTIVLDNDAAGWRWFVDSTPGDDSEYAGAGTRLAALDPNGVAGTRIDLLTVLTHELGHQIGLSDIYVAGDERRAHVRHDRRRRAPPAGLGRPRLRRRRRR